MSKNKWIRIFQISETKPHPAGHTIYRVTCSTFPVEHPDQATTISTWKRFSQFQSLHKHLCTVHKQLYLHGVFPIIPATGYFNRKDPAVVEQRRLWCLQFLEFVATQPILNTHTTFTNFLFDIEDGDLSSECGSLDKFPLGGPPRRNSISSLGSAGCVPAGPGVAKSCTLPDLTDSCSSAAGLEVVVTSDLSIDTTPTLTPTQTMASSDQDSGSDVQQSVENLCQLVAEMPESDIPEYISEAAEHISAALSYEAEEQFEASLSSYRSAIGKLLSCVQTDPDTARQAQVKRRIAQYISKAEQIVKREAELKTKKSTSRRSVGIPHLQLFGQLSELKQYKVRNILANKIILAETVHTGQLVIFKTLHKSPAVFKKSKTSLLPINISYMVRLLKYFETDDCVYLMLEYCSSGRMWDIVKPLVKQSEVACVTSVNDDVYDDKEPFERTKTPVQRQTSIIKPSQSFIRDRKKSINASSDLNTLVCDVDLSDDSNDDFDDISFVHANTDSVVVVNNDNIEHFEGYAEDEECPTFRAKSKNVVVQNSQKMLDHVSKTLNKNDGAKNVLDKLDDIENKIKQHLKGELSVDEETDVKVDVSEKASISEPLSSPGPSNETQSTPPSMTPSPTLPKRTKRPAVLRKLSELLPQCPETDLLESTSLPDRLVRTWAAEMAQVLSSLHYREVVIKDLNPANILLDSCGHVKLTYQCEWVSVDPVLSPCAVSGNYCAPEVVSVGDLTPAADWWSYGAILHLLYCGESPTSVIPTGLDSSIPLHFPAGVAGEVQDFIQQLLQVQPVNRLGAGSCGSNDVRIHPYFSGWDWDKMCWK